MKRLLLGLLSLLLGATFVVAFQAPAHAVATIKICNHASSVDDVHAYRLQSPLQEANIGQGTCATMNNDGGYVRVDVDLGGHEGDVDSWYKKRNSEPWAACVNNEEEASNPYNGATTTYRTFGALYCPA